MVPQVPAADAPGVADHALIALLALLPLAEAWWYWPRIVRALADRVPGTRRRAYRNLIVLEWTFAAAVVALWVLPHRAWAVLHVAAGRPVPIALGAAFIAGYVALAPSRHGRWALALAAVNYAWASVDRDGQYLQDRIAGTRLVTVPPGS